MKAKKYLSFTTITKHMSMNAQFRGPSNFLRWTVKKISNNNYSVAATTNGLIYEFVGNFNSLQEAHIAGRRFLSDLTHGTLKSGKLGVLTE